MFCAKASSPNQNLTKFKGVQASMQSELLYICQHTKHLDVWLILSYLVREKNMLKSQILKKIWKSVFPARGRGR